MIREDDDDEAEADMIYGGYVDAHVCANCFDRLKLIYYRHPDAITLEEKK